MITTNAGGARSVHAADLDGDSDADVLSASKGDNKIAWYTNDGNGEFFGQKIIDQNAIGAESVFAADLDNDDDVDVISASGDNDDESIAWYKNQGNGEFSDPKKITSDADRAWSVFAGDLDGDGDKDVISASGRPPFFESKIAWYKNNENGSFSDQKIISLDVSEPRDVFAADLNGDGNIDVLSASREGDKVSWYKNNGDGSFSDQKVITSDANGAQSVHAADLDGDSDLDVLSASWFDSTVAWYENDGLGGFSDQKVISTDALSPSSIYAEDLTGNGDKDVIAADAEDHQVSWFKNQGDGQFSDQKVTTSDAIAVQSVYSTDLDNDGESDILSASEIDNKIAWYKNIPNLPPAASSDSADTIRGRPVTTPVLANDSDPDGSLDTSSVQVETPPSNGSTSVDASTGAITYTPESGFTGTDSYTYVVKDDDGATSDEATVTVSVTDPPLTVTDVQPKAGIQGTEVHLYGTGFQPSPEANDVTFGEKEATVTSVSANVLSVTVPEGVEPGPTRINVSVGEKSALGSELFDLLEMDQGGAIADQEVVGSLEAARSIVSADLDDDEDHDILAASADGPIQWHRNSGGGNFSSGLLITEGPDTGTKSLYVADLNGDGDRDIISGSNSVGWYKNNGDGSFSERIEIIPSDKISDARSVHAADINMDGKLDVIYSGSFIDKKIAWNKNNGDGSFSEQIVIDTGVGGENPLRTEDLDSDGDQDILLSSGNKIVWYENKEGSSFSERKIAATDENGVGSAYIADIDNDNNSDIVSTGGTLDWYNGDGNGNFFDKTIISTEGGSLLSVNDMNGDSYPDVIYKSSEKIIWHKNEEGGFAEQKVISTDLFSLESIHVRDLDEDGDQDLISTFFDVTEHKVSWFENKSNQPPTASSDTVETNQGEPVTTTVLSNDSDPDGTLDSSSVQVESGPSNGSATANNDGTVTYEPEGSFTGEDSYTYTVKDDDGAESNEATVTISVTSLPLTVTAFQPKSGISGTEVHLYGVGFKSSPNANNVTFGGADAMVTAADSNMLTVKVPDAEPGPRSVSVTVGEQTGTATKRFDVLASGQGGSFSDQKVITTNADGARSVITADLDEDGRKDVLSASKDDNKVAWYKNEGGTFSGQKKITTNAEDTWSVFASDLDGDGDKDVLSSSFTPDRITWYENEGVGAFSAQKVVKAIQGFTTSVRTADLDGDGDEDILFTLTDPHKIAWCENEGAGTFSDPKDVTTAVDQPLSVFTVDLDDDGDRDILSASSNDGKIAWYENKGGGTFASQKVISTVSFPSAVYATDLDGDGDEDILSVSSGPEVAWHENEEGESFSDPKVITTDPLGAFSVTAADVDGDGDRDVLYASNLDDEIAWCENEGAGTFSDPKIITTNADGVTSIFAADLNSDGTEDVVSASANSNEIAWYENVDGLPLAAPTDLTATSADGKVNLTWRTEGGSSPAGYNVYRSTSSFSDISNATNLNDAPVSETSFADTEVTNGTEYFYRVTAVGSEGNESSPSAEASATPVALEDQVWATIQGEGNTYEVHIVSEEPINDLQSRALARSTDQGNLRHIYVVDGEGDAVSEGLARQLLFEVQSARKTAESGSQVQSALEDFGLQSQDYEVLNRNVDDPTSMSYTARAPSATSDLFRRLFIFQPNIDFGLLVPGIDAPGNRRDLYADVLFDAVLQPDIAGDFHGSLTDRLNQLGSAAGLSAEALETFEMIRNGGTITKNQLQTTLDNFQSVTTNLKAAEYLGKASTALSAAGFAADLKSDAAEYYLLQALANAEAAARLEALERWFIAEGPADPALQNALGDVRDRFENYVSDEENGWLSDLTGAMGSAVNAENLIELAKLTSEIQSVLGNLSPALQAAIKPWALNWTIGKKIREQTYAGGRATVAATLWPPLMDRIQTLESNVSGGTIDRDDARELVHLASASTYLSWHFYDRYLRISNNTITNFGAIAGSVLNLDGDGWDNYDQFISHLQNRRSKSETMHGRTAPPTFFAGRSSLTGDADREFAFLLNLLRDEKPDLGDPPPLVADFSVSRDTGAVPLEIEFTDLSSGEIDSWEWRFGDGTTHEGPNPSPKTYDESGTYTIVLTVSNEEGAEDRQRTSVTASAAPTIAEIGGTTISNTLATKNAATTVEFTNASEGTDLSFEWQFGDGTSSTEKNPTHTYEHAGTYTVTLHAYGEGGQDVGTAQDLVQVDGPTGTVTVETNTDESAYGVGGPAFYLGGESTSQTFENVPAGEYTAAFADVGQKDAPPSQTLQVEPDEEESVSATYLTIPSGLSVEASEGQVALSWNTDGADNLAGHDVYRSTSSFSDISNATKLNGSPVSSTSYTDTEVETGTTYYYRVTTVGDDGRESDPSTMASILLRQQQIAASITRSFGDASGPSDYLLVALPGSVDRPLGSTVSGESGVEWQAYWDDGSSQDYFQKYDGSDTFAFRAGRGFWLTSTQEWTFDESLPVVELGSGNATKIPLHDGWNIVSNPLEEDVSWEEIKTANGGVLQPLWTFNGGFSQADTFQTAATGQAYYFLNDEELDSLIVPFPGTSVANGAALASATGRSEEASSSGRIRLLASVGDSLWSAVRVGVAEEGSEDSDAKNIAAPPVRFSKLSLRLEATEDDSARQQLLATEYRSPSAGTEGGHTFNLRLQNKTGAPVRLEASGLEALNGREVALLNRITGRSYDLRDRGSVTVAKADSTALRLAMGSGAYVQDQAEKVVPNKVSLTSYPNPTSGQATLEYTLPEAKEVRLTVYDVLGRQVAVLEQGRKEAGRYRTRLDGSQLSSGVYFGRLRVGNKTRTQKITVVR